MKVDYRSGSFQKSFKELKKGNVRKQQVIVSKFFDDHELALASIRSAMNSSGGIWNSKIGGYQPFSEFAHETLVRHTYNGMLFVSNLREEILPMLVQTHSGLTTMTVEEYLDYVTVDGECNFTISW